MKKRVITEEVILECALNFVIENGIDNLNARSLAKMLKCSTQPIYLSFINMDDLKFKLLARAKRIFSLYLTERLKDYDSLFMGYIASYIKFAYDYPKLYEFMYLKMECNNTKEDIAYNETIIKEIAKAGNYSYQIAEKFYIQSFIYAHGFATQIVTGYIKWDFNVILEFLNDEFMALKLKYKGENLDGSN